jgi:hypothetical protein
MITVTLGKLGDGMSLCAVRCLCACPESLPVSALIEVSAGSWVTPRLFPFLGHRCPEGPGEFRPLPYPSLNPRHPLFTHSSVLSVLRRVTGYAGVSAYHGGR